MYRPLHIHTYLRTTLSVINIIKYKIYTKYDKEAEHNTD